MDIATWLGHLGLERYAQAFHDHDVDVRALARLSETDLVELGVKSVGHRRMLMEAIAALDVNARPPLAAQPDAEHRQLTVMYCAMEAATARSSGPSAEEAREEVRSFHQACTRAVADFDGDVANFFGDSMLAYFGWPRAHEDDAERAVRAALVLTRMVHRAGSVDVAQPWRVGIATGTVVVGDLVGEGPARWQSAVGVTPNLGARLLGLAAPGQVVIDESTRRLLASGFVLQLLGHHALKGISEPVACLRDQWRAARRQSLRRAASARGCRR